MENQVGIERREILYSPSKWRVKCEPENAVAEHVHIVTEESNNVKNEIEYQENVRYGPLPNQLLDVYGNKMLPTDAPTLVYIHGGYWQELGKDISCYCVKPLVNAGIRVIIPGYDLAPEVSLDTIIREIKQLSIFISEMSKRHHWGVTWYSGHSAGAHLAACVLCSEISPKLDIAGFILISGIYDLQPLIGTSINYSLKLSTEEAYENSPLFKVKEMGKHFYNGIVLIFTAQYDSPAFHEQSRRFSKALRNLNIRVENIAIDNLDHFDIVENLRYDDYYLTIRILESVKQAM